MTRPLPRRHFLRPAATGIVLLPVIVLFFFTRKAFIRGLATTGPK